MASESIINKIMLTLVFFVVDIVIDVIVIVVFYTDCIV